MKRLILLVLGFICWQGVVQAKNYFYVTALEDSVCVAVGRDSFQYSFDGEIWKDWPFKSFNKQDEWDSTLISLDGENWQELSASEDLWESSFRDYEKFYNDGWRWRRGISILQLSEGQKLYIRGGGSWRILDSTSSCHGLNMNPEWSECVYVRSLHSGDVYFCTD